MRSQTRRSDKQTAGLIVSLVVHGTALLFALALGVVRGAKVNDRPETLTVAQLELAGGAHAAPIPLPRMLIAAETRKPARDEEVKLKAFRPVKPVPVKVKDGGGAPAVPLEGYGSGNAAGNGADDKDAVPAFPVFSPKPAVTDRGLLPATEQKIVVDVKVDESGAVVSESLIAGMGTALDQIVLDTVKTWRFEPAKVNGKAVATEAELIFPFDLKYPIG